MLGVVVSALFVLGHDAAHDALLPKSRWNRTVALVFMLPSLHVRDGWVFGHNRVHHGFTVKRAWTSCGTLSPRRSTDAPHLDVDCSIESNGPGRVPGCTTCETSGGTR